MCVLFILVCAGAVCVCDLWEPLPLCLCVQIGVCSSSIVCPIHRRLVCMRECVRACIVLCVEES